MPRPLDLPRIRRALVNLDRIAAEHPEYCQHRGQWDESEVEKVVMATSVNERMKAHRARLQAEGYWRLSAFITPEAQESLNQLRQAHPDLTLSELVSAVFTGQLSPERKSRVSALISE
jgi:hypothetical protein